MTKQFINPWKDLPNDAVHKTTVNVSRVTMSKISRVHSKQGVLQTTIYLLISKLTDELERLNINEYDPGTYEVGVANCTITLGLPERSATSVPSTGAVSAGPAEAASRDVGHGTPGLAQSVPGPASTPDSHEPTKPARKRRTKGKTGEETQPCE